MTTPMRRVPDGVMAWVHRRRWLRWGDAGLAWALLWSGWMVLLAGAYPRAGALASLALVVGLAWIHVLRVRWRPLSGWVGLHVSRALRPGDRAWYVAHDASLVVVTARRGARMMIARPDLVEDEVIRVRRTRVFLLPADE